MGRLGLVIPLAASLIGSGARAESAHTYEIQPGSLGRALHDFSSQSDWPVLYTRAIVAGRRTGGFSGRAASTAVLARLLSGTGLTYRVANADTLLIVEDSRRDSPPQAPASHEPVGRLPRPSGSDVGDPELEVVVVTATRQSESLDRVPLSIAALTWRYLDQSGVRTFADIVGVASAVSLSQTTPGVANVAIRGIRNSPGTNTQPTTGFYLDDTPLQKRNSAGFLNGNGTPLPPLFDLDRIEVLRGPQGTLFGGSSEGGTIRYITTAPSLNSASVYARAEASLTQDGDATVETGLAVGIPVAPGKLGIRASVFTRKQGGYIDYIDPFTGDETLHNANSGETRMARLAVRWAPMDRARATLTYFTSIERTASNQTAFTLDTIKTPIVEQPVCVDAKASAAASGPFPPTDPCSGASFVRSGGVFGPYQLSPYDFVSAVGRAPAKTITQIGNLTLDYDLGAATVKAISSYLRDENATYSQALTNELNQRNGVFEYAGAPPSIAFPAGGTFTRGMPWSYALRAFGRDGPPYYGYADVKNYRRGFVQELRFASGTGSAPLSWVAGVFYANNRVTTRWRGTSGEAISNDLYGLTTVERYGVPLLTDPDTGLPILYASQAYKAKDVEVAAFAEANYAISERLGLTAGARVSHTTFDFHGDVFAGSSGVAYPPLTRNASISESPVTPKLGVQYQLSGDDMVYATASKGFRTGGVNPTPPPATCDSVFGRFGLTTRDVPVTYNSDTVWSYEAGGKFRILHRRVQLNGGVYRIEWSNIQTPINFAGCGTQYIVNSGSARSQGFEVDAQAKVFAGLSANLAVAYNDARNRSSIFLPAAPGFTPTLATAAGERFAIPAWSANVRLRYDFPLNAKARLYARGDWRWTSRYAATPPAGVQGYSPDQMTGQALSKLNLRAGIELGAVDLNLFANNLALAHGGSVAGGRIGCTPMGGAACTTYTAYTPFLTTSWGTPAQFGIQFALRR